MGLGLDHILQLRRDKTRVDISISLRIKSHINTDNAPQNLAVTWFSSLMVTASTTSSALPPTPESAALSRFPAPLLLELKALRLVMLLTPAVHFLRVED